MSGGQFSDAPALPNIPSSEIGFSKMKLDKYSWLFTGWLTFALGSALAVLVGIASPIHGQERAVGDIWRGDAPSPDWREEQAAAAYAMRSKRHRAYLQGGVPPEYRNAHSPYPSVAFFIEESSAIYAKHCAHCHGDDGFGDGDAAMDLRPTPAVLAFMIKSPDSVDSYLMWTIYEGGAEFGTDMPAYKDVLTQREVWKLILYMRAGFPSPDGSREE
jgi:hypothetical protein